MPAIHRVKLELLRPGPAHNQLLSPLTPYLALCGADGPVTVHMPYEHRQLLTRLERLRYGDGEGAIVETQREAELRDIGEAIGRVFGEVPGLLAALGNARSEDTSFVHLRLSLSALELGLIPFEAAIAPDGFPASGSPLFLQTRTPISITREVRRGQTLPVAWNRPPRILFAFASPPGFAAVPAQDHLDALRRAIDPWVRITDTPEARIAEVKKILTVIPNATAASIRAACAARPYTHVHLLAHGAPIEKSADRRFGVVLCSRDNVGGIDVVEGDQLAALLSTRDFGSGTTFRPTLVTLATCDSGNANSPLTPGGSIAHALHAAEIPWVIASQFPLWMRASTIMVEVLYSRLLKGEDPRWTLHELRQRLRTDSPRTHDWASIVAYATVPWGFERQVEEFRDDRTRRLLDVLFERIDGLVGADTGGSATAIPRDTKIRDEELESLFGRIRAELLVWRNATSSSGVSATVKAERLGMSGASEKRIGIAYELARRQHAGTDEAAQAREKGIRAYDQARGFYLQALEAAPTNHWAITQYLSITALPILCADENLPALVEQYGRWWTATQQLAFWQLKHATGEQRAWALGTLVELDLLGAVYAGANFNRGAVKQRVGDYCRQIKEAVGPSAFAVLSTRRQLTRYLEQWGHDRWRDIAKAGVAALSEDS